MQHRLLSMLAQSHTLTRWAYRISYTTTRTIITRSRGRSVIINQTSLNSKPTRIVIPPALRNWETTPLPESTTSNNNNSTHPKLERRPRNRQIPFDMVSVVDSETNKLSETKQSLKELLETTNLHKYCIELVSSNQDNPIVRVAPKMEVEEKYKQLKRAIRKGQKISEAPKEVRIMCGVAKADLHHKLRKGKSHLEKGHSLVFLLTSKPRQPPPTAREKDELMAEIAAAIDGVGVEWKPMVTSGKQTLLYFKPSEVKET